MSHWGFEKTELYRRGRCYSAQGTGAHGLILFAWLLLLVDREGLPARSPLVTNWLAPSLFSTMCSQSLSHKKSLRCCLLWLVFIFLDGPIFVIYFLPLDIRAKECQWANTDSIIKGTVAHMQFFYDLAHLYLMMQACMKSIMDTATVIAETQVWSSFWQYYLVLTY